MNITFAGEDSVELDPFLGLFSGLFVLVIEGGSLFEPQEGPEDFRDLSCKLSESSKSSDVLSTVRNN